MQDGNLINSEDVSEVVYSGQSVSYIPRVNSERAPGYIRIAGSLNIPGKDPIPLTKSNVTTSSAAGLGEGWIERGGYFEWGVQDSVRTPDGTLERKSRQ